MHNLRCPVAVCAPLACLILATSASAQAPASCPGAQQAPTAKTIATARLATLCLINRERVARGLPPVAESPVVGWTAQTHSEVMVATRSFAHSKGVAQLLQGVYWAFGQNIAWAEGGMAAPDTVVAAWMASASHRRNILNSDFNHVGIGIVMGAPEATPLSAATYATDFGAAIVKQAADETEEKADAANMDAVVVAPAVAPPGAERPIRPNVRLPKVTKRARVCTSKSRAARRRSACVKRRPKITIKTKRGGDGATSFLVPESR